MKLIATSNRSAGGESNSSSLLLGGSGRERYFSFLHENWTTFSTSSGAQNPSFNLRDLFTSNGISRHTLSSESAPSNPVKDDCLDETGSASESNDSELDCDEEYDKADDLTNDENTQANSEDYFDLSYDDHVSSISDVPHQDVNEEESESDNEAFFGHQESFGQFLKNITISQDQTAASNFHKDQLAYLQPTHRVEAPVEQQDEISYLPPAPDGNNALQDYQMQLMLLEQQNKERIMMARQEQDTQAFGVDRQQDYQARLRVLEQMNERRLLNLRKEYDTQAPGLSESAPASSVLIEDRQQLIKEASASAESSLRKDTEHQELEGSVHSHSSVVMVDAQLPDMNNDPNHDIAMTQKSDGKRPVLPLDISHLSPRGEDPAIALLKRIDQLEEENRELKRSGDIFVKTSNLL